MSLITLDFYDFTFMTIDFITIDFRTFTL